MGENLKVEIEFVKIPDEPNLEPIPTNSIAEFIMITYPGALVDKNYFVISGPRDVVNHVLT